MSYLRIAIGCPIRPEGSKHPITSFRHLRRASSRVRERSREAEQSMASQRPQSSASTDAIQRDEARVPANQSLVLVAERELLAALSELAPLAFGAHPHPSPEETAAFDRAVHALCHEAHRLDLRV